MTTELSWLLYTALLAGCLWMPYVVGVNVTDFPGKSEQFVRPPDHRGMSAWVHRSFRAQANMIEQLVPFAIVVLVGHAAGVCNGVTRICPMAFFGVRVVHAAGYISGLARLPLRPILYFSGWVITLIHASQVLLGA
jgi:uncharacterized MAPEG superfamily protein